MSGCPMWSPWGWTRHRGIVDPDLRVSDAERSEVADTLSKHYAEGRLDRAELDERLQRAMAAKTRRDLGGLLTDLPSLVPPAPVRIHRHRSGVLLVLLTVFLFFAAASSAAWEWHWDGPWFLVALVLFVLWRRSRWHGHHHRRWRGGWGPMPPAGPPEAWPGRDRWV